LGRTKVDMRGGHPRTTESNVMLKRVGRGSMTEKGRFSRKKESQKDRSSLYASQQLPRSRD